MIQEGTIAPEFSLDQLDGNPISLSEALKPDHKILLIFLRYLG